MPDYGDIVLKRHADGTVTVVQADDTIGVSAEFLANLSYPNTNIRNGMLVFDTAGKYRYRPIRFADGGRIVVCERWCECRDWAVADIRVGWPNGHHVRCPKRPGVDDASPTA